MKRQFGLPLIATGLAAICMAVTSCKTTTQEPEAPEALDLRIRTITEVSVTETSITVAIDVPEDATGYTYAIGQPEDLSAFRDNTLEGIITQSDPSITEVTFDGLTKLTEYTIFARAFAETADGTETGSVRQIVVTTDGEAELDTSFSAKLNTTTETSALINVSYGADITGITYGFGTADDREAFENGTLENIVSSTTTSSVITVSGLEKATTYTIFLQGTARNGQKTDIVEIEAATLNLMLSLSIDDSENSADRVGIVMTPGGDTYRYKYCLASIEIYEAFESGEWFDVEWQYDATQPVTIPAESLDTNQEFTIFAQPFAENNARGSVVYLTIGYQDGKWVDVTRPVE